MATTSGNISYSTFSSKTSYSTFGGPLSSRSFSSNKGCKRLGVKTRKIAKAIRTKIFEYTGTTTYGGVRVYTTSGAIQPHGYHNLVVAAWPQSKQSWNIGDKKYRKRSIDDIASEILLSVYI